MTLQEFIDFYFRGRHRLETIAMLPLGCTLADAIALYGEPLESSPAEVTSEITQHIFAPGPYDEVRVWEWKNAIHSIVYCSVKGDPARDLKYVLENYQGSSTWSVMEQGYWYQRADRTVRLWCSAVPAIGVGFVEFLKAKEAYKLAHDLDQLDHLTDVTWAPDNTVLELQRQFAEKGNARLFELADRSDKIAVSPDGKTVFIVRNHHAYDVSDGFREMNKPPDPGHGYSTEVINCFRWGNDGSCWSKVTLPRDAHVERIGIDGETCYVDIKQTTTGRVLKFSGSASSVGGLAGISGSAPHLDAELWRELTEAAGNPRQ